MNYLLSYGAAGIGDFIATMQFLRDFEEQMPNDKLYLRFEIPYMEKKYSELLLNNPYWHQYDNSQNIDKTIHFGWGENINEVEQLKFDEDCPYVYTDVIYHEFNKRAGTAIKKSRPRADFYFSEDELVPVIKSDKPICIINIGYNIMYGNSRNWGWPKFQHLVEQLEDKITFVQVGSTKNGYYHFPLNGCINLLDKSPLRLTLRLLRQARFVITHNSGLLHMAAFDSDIKRTIYCLMGGKDYYNFFDCYDAKNVELSFVKNNLMFMPCFEKGKYCCDAGIVFQTGLPKVGNAKICKHPSYDQFGNVICSCFNYLDPNILINSIQKHLDDDNHHISFNEHMHIDIGMACTKNHLIHVIETLNSINNNCSFHTTVHIVVDCIPKEIDNIQNDISFICTNKLKVKIYSLTCFENKLDMNKIKLNQSKMTYARLYSDSFIEKSIDKLLWIETDVIVNSNEFNEFLCIDFEDNYAVAVEDPSVELFASNEMMNCNTKRYLNGGLILFNLKKMREDGLFAKFNDFVHHPPEWFMKNNIFDQTILNYFFAGKIKFAEMKFNVQTAMFAYPQYDQYAQHEGYLDQHDLFKHAAMSHMMQVKPWDEDYESFQPHQRIYKRWQKKLYEKNVEDCIKKYGDDYLNLKKFQ